VGVGEQLKKLASNARSAALYPSHAYPCLRHGLTLIEMMISVVLTLMIVFAVVQAFQMMGTGMTNGRAAIEIMASVRSPVAQLQRELDNVTCPVRPVIDPRQGLGYFYYYEGPNSDRNFNASDEADNVLKIDAIAAEATHFGDTDDILAFTCTRPDAPFQGQALLHDDSIVTMESTTAEVVWWMATVLKPDARGNLVESVRVLMHRVFLIRPDIPPYDSSATHAASDIKLIPSLQSDISATTIGTISAANTLGTVTNPANRVLNWHRIPLANRNYFPQYIVDAPALPINPYNGWPATYLGWLPQMERFIVANDMLAFDVRAFDPMAPIMAESGANGSSLAVSPSDPAYPGKRLDEFNNPSNYFQKNLANMMGRGAFVDLGYLVSRKRSSSTALPPNPAGGNNGGNPFEQIGLDQIKGDRWPFGMWKLTNGTIGRVSHFSGFPSFRDGPGKLAIGGAQLSANDKVWVATTRHDNLSIAPGTGVQRTLLRYEFLELFRYDTWSSGFEFDGIDQDGDSVVDQGTNGVDDNAKAGVDDPSEMETMAPYPVPLRGIEVRVRKWDPGTRQVRQVSIVSDFVPE
jgi:hypothetical protein